MLGQSVSYPEGKVIRTRIRKNRPCLLRICVDVDDRLLARRRHAGAQRSQSNLSKLTCYHVAYQYTPSAMGPTLLGNEAAIL